MLAPHPHRMFAEQDPLGNLAGHHHRRRIAENALGVGDVLCLLGETPQALPLARFQHEHG